MQDRLPIYSAELYRQIAEMRAFRLSGYTQPLTCTASIADITAIEREIGNGQIIWAKDQQERVVNAVIDKLIAAHMH